MYRFASLAWFAALLTPAPALAQYGWHHQPYRQAYPAQPEDLVISWYQRYLGRQPEPSGLVGTLEALRAGQTPEAVAASILGGVEFYSKAGYTPEGYIRNLFQALTDRPPTQQEFGYWMQQLSFASRTDVAYALLARHPQSWATQAYHPDVPRYDYRLPTWPYRR